MRSPQTSGPRATIMHCIIRSFPVWMLLLLGASHAHAADGPTIRLNGDQAKTVDVAGLTAKDLDSIGKLGLKDDEWRALFSVYVAPASGKERGPALLGAYRVEDGMLRFEPRFPLVPGVRYQVVFEPVQVLTRAALKEK